MTPGDSPLLEIDEQIAKMEEDGRKVGGTLIIPEDRISGLSIDNLREYLIGRGYQPTVREGSGEICIDCAPRYDRGNQNA
jgi:hypothetical protein